VILVAFLCAVAGVLFIAVGADAWFRLRQG
jgi:hypothetical protein